MERIIRYNNVILISGKNIIESKLLEKKFSYFSPFLINHRNNINVEDQRIWIKGGGSFFLFRYFYPTRGRDKRRFNIL